MARGFGAFVLVLLGALAGGLIAGLMDQNTWSSIIVVAVVTVAVAAWVIVYWQKENKKELEAQLSLLKDKLDKLEQKDKE